MKKISETLKYGLESILFGENLVVRRLRFIGVEDDFQKTSLNEKHVLGYSSVGNIVHISFTKNEYEKERNY